jgi:beta-glucosidase
MTIVPYDLNFTICFIELVEEGWIPIERIKDAVGRILRVKSDVGLWQTPITNPTNSPKIFDDQNMKK